MSLGYVYFDVSLKCYLLLFVLNFFSVILRLNPFNEQLLIKIIRLRNIEEGQNPISTAEIYFKSIIQKIFPKSWSETQWHADSELIAKKKHFTLRMEWFQFQNICKWNDTIELILILIARMIFLYKYICNRRKFHFVYFTITPNISLDV